MDAEQKNTVTNNEQSLEAQPATKSLLSRMFQPSLTRTLLLWFLLLSLLPMLLVSGFNLKLSKESLHRSTLQVMAQRIDLQAQFIDNWFDFRFRDLQVQAENSNNTRFLQQLINGFQLSDKKLSDFVGSYAWSKIVEENKLELESLSKTYDYIYDIFLVDLNGNILFTLAQENDLGTSLYIGRYRNTLFAKTVRQSLDTGESLFSDLEHYAPSHNIVAGFLTAPLLDDGGEKIGLIAIQLEVGRISELMQKRVGSTGTEISYLIGEDLKLRSVIASHPEQRILEARIDTEQTRKWLPVGAEQEVNLVNKAPQVVIEYLGPFGEKVLGIQRPLRIAGIRWNLIAEVDQSQALAATRELSFLAFSLLALLFFVVVSVAIIISDRIVKPIRQLVEANRLVSDGDLEQKVEINSNNEVGLLATSFNKMLLARQQHEAQLKRSYDETKQALDDLAIQKFALDQHSIVAITDAAGTITFTNKKFTEISGYTNEELIGQNHRMLKSGVHTKQFFNDLFSVITHGLVWRGEICNRAKDGHLYWVDTTIVPVLGEKGKPKNYIALRTEITDRKAMELALAEEKAQVDLVIANTGVGIWDWNIQSGDCVFNKRWANIIGYRLDELESTDAAKWNEYIHPDDLTEMSKALEKHFDGKKKEYIFEIRMRHKDGHWVWVLDTGRVVERDNKGSPVRMIGTHLDISNNKKVELELMEARDEANLASKAKSEFLANMSHEIRTPMNGVLGMLGLLKNSSLTKKQQHQLHLAHTSADSLLALINDILDFSKIEAGKLELECIDFDLRRLVGDLAESMALQAQDKGLEIVLDVTGIHQSRLRGDPGRVRQLLLNIIGNAVKFTLSGEVVIRISAQDSGESGLIVYGSVSDTGIGMEPEKLEHLFTAFSQADSSTTRQFGGTGLGLTICKQISELMGGGITVISQLGQGSTFNFTLCLQRSDESVIVKPAVDIRDTPILIVDDNTTNREVLRGQLESWGANVTEAVNGPSALLMMEKRLATEETFPVAILDMQMPGMDGAELGKTIRKDARYENTRLIIMTSMSERGDAQYFADLGFDAYFSKPATTSDLFDALAIVLGGGKALTTARPLVTHDYLQTLEPAEQAQGIRVLLVEDNVINQEVAQGILEDFSYTVDVAENGVQALAKLNHAMAAYQLILMDCQMPEMDGYEATAKIRAGKGGQQYCNIPIIAMTANAMAGDREKCLQAGMDDYLAKPIDPDRLEAKLKQWQEQGFEINTTKEASGFNEPSAEVTSPKNDEDPIWDEAALLKRVRGKAYRLLSLADLFNREMDERVKALQQAIEASDTEKIDHIAHTIKGASGNMGGVKVQRLAGQIERAAKQGDNDEPRRLLPSFLEQYKQLSQKLDEFCKRRQAVDKTLESVPAAIDVTSNEQSSGHLCRLLQQTAENLQQGLYIDPSHLSHELNQFLAEPDNEPVIQQLIQQVSTFNSEGAIETIERIALTRQITLELKQ